MLHVARFLHGYLRPHATALREAEVRVPTAGGSVPGTLMAVEGARGTGVGWVVLHGITVPGRHHPSLLRFARALAASGGTVLVPEVPAWRELRVDPAAAHASIAAGVEFLTAHPEQTPGGVGVVGFSFGATQALVSAADPALRGRLRAVVGFGGYCDLERTLRFMLTGEHEWAGLTRRADPDPYGRWIVAANYLTGVPEYAGMQRVAEAARQLAAEAGRSGAYAGEAVFDPLKARLRAEMTPEEQRVWALLAPPTGEGLPVADAAALAERLVAAALRRHPELDPRPALPHLRTRVVLAHGVEDRLVPCSETLRLAAHIPPAALAGATLTRLFAHSRGADALRLWQYPAEAARFVRLLGRALARG